MFIRDNLSFVLSELESLAQSTAKLTRVQRFKGRLIGARAHGRSTPYNNNQGVGRRRRSKLSRDGTEKRRTLKASKLRECENISLFRHFIILYGRYSSIITS